MSTSLVFAVRNRKELLRDPLNVLFAIGFPVVVMLLLTLIQANVPVSLFALEQITPGLAVFGLSFVSLFSGMLIAKDRSSSFLMRLFASPMQAGNFIAGYILPLLPLALAQSAICYAVAILLGLKITLNILLGIAVLVPSALLFIGIGLLAGSLLNDKQVGGICGALLTNITAWLSGTWFDLDLVGDTFKKVAYALPFAHAVDAGKAALAGNYSQILPHLLWVAGYAAVVLLIAILVFRKRMKSATI